MQKTRRNSRASTKKPVEDEIAHLRGLDLSGVRSRWQSVFQRQAPVHLTRHLLFAVIAYHLQASHFGLWVGGNLPLGYEMKDGKIAVAEEEAELVRSIFRRYLELGSVNELLRDL
jgi:hypothetical protein